MVSGMKKQELEKTIAVYDCLAKFREPLFRELVKSFQFPAWSKGLDAGCGIGSITKLLFDAVNETGDVTGLDISPELISIAQNRYPNIKFTTGDINDLPFHDNSFDWIWSTDTLWSGPKESGCPATTPEKILAEYKRVVKPGGKIILLFWSTQKFLAGYPLLESKLNNTLSANAPFNPSMQPELHFMKLRGWLEKAGMQDVKALTFAGDLEAPLNDTSREALQIFCDMLWGGAEDEIDDTNWQTFKDITNPDSDNYLFSNPDYYGFYTYTIFSGTV